VMPVVVIITMPIPVPVMTLAMIPMVMGVIIVGEQLSHIRPSVLSGLSIDAV
jgi:hypothetical protein